MAASCGGSNITHNNSQHLIVALKLPRNSAEHSPCFCCLVFTHYVNSAAVVDVQQRGLASLSPVTRVVQLLKDLLEKTKDELKAEEDLYETFVCWATLIISQSCQLPFTTLETYLADHDSGRIELTTDRADLTKEIETLNADIREKENKD